MRTSALATILCFSQVRGHDPPEVCCFNLEATTVGAHVPGFILESTSERYCLDAETSRLVDPVGRRGKILPAKVPIRDLTHGRDEGSSGSFGIETTDGGEVVLVHDHITNFILQQGPEPAAFGFRTGLGKSESFDNGIAVRLFLRRASIHCEALYKRHESSDLVPRAGPPRPPRPAGRRGAGRNPKSTATVARGLEGSPTATVTPWNCDISRAGHSLAPDALLVRPVNETACAKTEENTFMARIDSQYSTEFQFTLTELVLAMPPTFSNESSSRLTCGLQFRLPVCTQLPAGYPCYEFSGMEQEVIQQFGMRFTAIWDTLEMSGWRPVSLAQVWAGEDTLVGTFDCGEGSGIERRADGKTHKDGRGVGLFLDAC